MMPKTKPRKPLSWKPVQHGTTYCSPACGARCKLADFAQAHEDGEALAKTLGEDWTVRVWENMGWHYEAISPCGRMKVQSSSRSGYLGFLGEKGKAGGWWGEHGDTPQEAVDATIAKGKAEQAKINARLEGF